MSAYTALSPFFMATLREIEIFYPGTHNGIQFSDTDMVEMVNNSNRCHAIVQPLISLDHDEVEHVPDVIRRAAFGMVSKFYLKVIRGVKRVFCDIYNVPEGLAELVKSYYPKRSIELFQEYETPTGEILKNVICGISFLGSKMPPALKGMFPDFVLSYQETPTTSRGAITLTLALENIMPRKKTSPKKKEAFQEDGADITSSTSEMSMFIATRRAELGLTEADVAGRMNANDMQPQVSEQTIQDLESGITIPSNGMMTRIEDALGLDEGTLEKLLIVPSAPEMEGHEDEPQPAAPIFSENDLRKVVRQVMREFADESLGAYMRRLREEAGMSIEELAQTMEVASDEIAGFEEAVIPQDEILEKYAAVFGLDMNNLRARRDAIKAAQAEPEADMPEEVQSNPELMQAFNDQLAPIRQEVERLTAERDAILQQKAEQDVDHFLDDMSLKFGASKVLTGERVRTLLLKLDDKSVMKFSKDATPQSPRSAFKALIEDVAKFGAEQAAVIRDQLVKPGEHDEPEDENLNEVGQIKKFQDQHGIKTWRQAVRKFYISQRKPGKDAE